MEKDPWRSGPSYEYREYKVNGFPLVGQTRLTLYSDPGNEALYSITDISSDGFYWDLVTSLRNDGAGDSTLSTSYTSELKVTSGSESELNMNLGLAFKGVSVGVGGSVKTFQSNETTESQTHSVQVTIPPQSVARLYQKIYRFKTWMWFIDDAWNELSRVGGQGNYLPSHVEGYVEIKSLEYFVRQDILYGSGRTTADRITNKADFKWTRKFKNTTRKCQRYLRDWRVTIPSS
ncbi:hypothetical protein BDV23DRAFT_73616 [Aspergillus alliaceus]|uniref:Uncharacterized protein n=1 Tax=Petromyces alliaceus TaxID=209559 RepID=A0A5N7CC33_PETAA|nr:hypothetical protein BDV23DRAFT_73616 [Aspergillus alliaceus]